MKMFQIDDYLILGFFYEFTRSFGYASERWLLKCIAYTIKIK